MIWGVTIWNILMMWGKLGKFYEQLNNLTLEIDDQNLSVINLKSSLFFTIYTSQYDHTYSFFLV